MKYAVGVMAWLVMASVLSAAPAPDSKRLALAKDYIADEQWVRAIAELQVVANDAREPNRDEAMFWLAHSEHATGDHGAALQTIARLERQFPTSRWARPARSLRVEIAQRLRRDDVLLKLAAPPPPPPAPPPGRTPVAARVHPGMVPPTPPPSPAPPAMPAGHAPAVAPPAPHSAGAPPPFPLTGAIAPPRPGALPDAPPPRQPVPGRRGQRPPSFFSREEPLPPGFPMPTDPFVIDTDTRIMALQSLIDTHSDRVIPLLRDIVLDTKNPNEARRALFVLAQSTRPEARRTVVEAAQRGPEIVRIAAIREMGRFRGANVNADLMQVYSTASTPRVKRQIVSSLGGRADNTSLLRIARSESDASVRNTAIVMLGQTGGREQLRTLYGQTPRESRVAVLSALFTARDDDGLIRIARTERDTLLRWRAREQLGMLATPKAVKFLAENP
jgi:hypothetical protein